MGLWRKNDHGTAGARSGERSTEDEGRIQLETSDTPIVLWVAAIGVVVLVLVVLAIDAWRQ